jgi:hypothetical protein
MVERKGWKLGMAERAIDPPDPQDERRAADEQDEDFEPSPELAYDGPMPGDDAWVVRS